MIFWVIFFVLLFWVNRIVVFIPITDAHPNIPWKWTNDIIVNLGATNRLMRDSNMWIFKVFWYLFILSSWDVFIKVIHISKCLLKISAEIESIKQLKLFKQFCITNVLISWFHFRFPYHKLLCSSSTETWESQFDESTNQSSQFCVAWVYFHTFVWCICFKICPRIILDSTTWRLLQTRNMRVKLLVIRFNFIV